MSYDTAVFIVVEGKVYDPYFVEKVCGSSANLAREGYEIKLVSQIGTTGGVYASGKEAVLSYFDYCKRARKLTQTNSKGKRAIAFFVDRDSQHLTGGMRRSPHVIYTRLADVEADIFSNANEVPSLATAASLDLATATELAQVLGDWRTRLADDWRPWIELCYLAEATKARVRGFGSATSRVHAGLRNRTLDVVAFGEVETEIARTSLLSSAEYQKVRTRILHKLRRIYMAGRQAQLLKGKWLPAQLTMAVEDFFSGGQYPGEWHREDFKGSVVRCYEANMNLSSVGVQSLRVAFEGLLDA